MSNSNLSALLATVTNEMAERAVRDLIVKRPTSAQAQHVLDNLSPSLHTLALRTLINQTMAEMEQNPQVHAVLELWAGPIAHGLYDRARLEQQLRGC
jgi:hypothetical protein